MLLCKSIPLAFVIILCVGPRFASAASDCSKLDLESCFKSKECTLISGEAHSYICRAKIAPCETGLAQFERGKDFKKECESRTGCAFSDPVCFCPNFLAEYRNVMCTCGGGPPPNCVKK